MSIKIQKKLKCPKVQSIINSRIGYNIVFENSYKHLS
jgi:hypothetical protein